METDITLLKNSKLFQGISETEIFPMLECLLAVTKTYQKGEAVFRRGERIENVAMLLEGSVHIQKEDYWGNLSILSEISAGEMFGEVYACLGSDEILNDAVAVKQSRVLFLIMKRILTMCPSACQFHGRLIRNLLSVLAVKNKVLTQKLGICRSGRQGKSFCPICQNSLRGRGSPEFDIPFNRQQMADYLSVDRSAMSAELGRMRDEGLLAFERNHFRLR